jgi:type 2 lantibiotic biosynthesis protein LanM
MKNPTIPFKEHINALILSEITHSDNTVADSLIANITSLTKFAFDQDFCDFGLKIFPLFDLQQSFNPMLQASDTILNDYSENFFNKNGIKEFAKKYPLIPVLTKKAVSQAENFYSEIDHHIAADKTLLSVTFNNGIALGNVVAIDTNRGDLHNGGKSTAIIEFQCGLKVVYKPRPGGLDAAFNQLLEDLSAKTEIQLKTVITLDRGDYFWMEFVEFLPVGDEKKLDDYYKRCGALLAVCYLLNGTDFHYENLIACGEFPVLIDLECLFGATDEMSDGSYSVYNTGLVPLFTYEDENTQPTDSSGFGASGQQVSGIEVWNWEGLETDALRLSKVKGTFTAETNQPVYYGQKISPENYLSQIIDGFTIICNWFISEKENIDNPGFILNVFKEKQFRSVIRNTVDYKAILDNSLIAKALYSEEDRKKQTYESLNEFQPFIYLNSNCRPKVISMEYEAIKALNIPLFTGNTTGRSLYESGQLVAENFFKALPYNIILTKIKNLKNEDIEKQTGLMISAFMLRYGRKSTEKKSFNEPVETVECNDQLLTDETYRIADAIKGSAIKSGDTYIWNSYMNVDNNRIVYNTLGNGFYEGNAGIACFYNIISASVENPEYAAMSNRIIDAEITRCNSEDYTVDISLATGLAGLIYTLIKSPSKGDLDRALSLLPLIKPEDILNDKKFDIMSGTAGLLQVLALLYNHTQSDEVLSIMILAGDHLINHLTPDEISGLRAWKTDVLKRPVTGYSHGVSGIACALLSLYECSGDEKYRAIFYEVLKFEDHYKDYKSSNWQDLRGHNENCKTAWCHGATGIGMARLQAYRILNDIHLLADIEMAITATLNSDNTGTDCYCCGISGRADFLIEAARVLDRPYLLEEARKMLMKIMSLKNARKHYCTHEIEEISLENPSLFRGVAGIGYVLLRAMKKSEVGCLGLLQ